MLIPAEPSIETPVPQAEMESPEGRAPRRSAVEVAAFFERLRAVLRARQMSQADLARQLRISGTTVSEWFTRGRMPHGDVMLRMPEVLEVNGHWLLTGQGSRDRVPSADADPYFLGAQHVLREMQTCLQRVEQHFAPRASSPESGRGVE